MIPGRVGGCDNKVIISQPGHGGLPPGPDQITKGTAEYPVVIRFSMQALRKQPFKQTERCQLAFQIVLSEKGIVDAEPSKDNWISFGPIPFETTGAGQGSVQFLRSDRGKLPVW